MVTKNHETSTVIYSVNSTTSSLVLVVYGCVPSLVKIIIARHKHDIITLPAPIINHLRRQAPDWRHSSVRPPGAGETRRRCRDGVNKDRQAGCWVELQTNLREDYAKFYNHGEGPY